MTGFAKTIGPVPQALPVPAEILKQHVAVLGKTRSGKSSVMRGLVEHLLARREPVCIVDPKGDWWGIKLAADGKGPGYPVVIFGGDHADVPINEHAGAHVAELFATGNRPCLIDLGGWMVGPRTRFWIDFASTLFKHTRGERWLVVDEIHNFAPKGKVFDADAGKALHWTNRLASEGLGKGVSMLFASQRPQKVHNDTLTSAETLIAMRVLHPSDRGAVAEWIKGCGDADGGEVLKSLAQMARGEGWVWSPEIGFGPERVQFPLFRTYDSFRPQTPDDAKRLTGWAEVDLDEVRAKMNATIERAKADDPRELKKQIAEKDRDLARTKRALEMATAGQQALAGQRQATIEIPVLTDADRALLERCAAALTAAADRAKATAAAARTGLVEDINQAALDYLVSIQESGRLALVEVEKILTRAGFQQILGKLSALPVPTSIPTTTKSTRGQVTPRAVTARPAVRAADGQALGKGEHVILTAVAQHQAGVTREQLSVLTGYKRSSRDTYLQRLAAAGHVEIMGGQIVATERGLAELGDDFEPLPTGEALREFWLGELPEGERKVLQVLISAYPQAVAREAIDEATGYRRSSRDTYLQRLAARKLVTVEGRGAVKASEELFS